MPSSRVSSALLLPVRLVGSQRAEIAGDAPAAGAANVEPARTAQRIERELRAGDEPILPAHGPRDALEVPVDVGRGADRQADVADRELAGLVPVAAEIEIDEVGEGAPSAVVRLERAHDGEFQVLEDVEVDRRAARVGGHARLAAHRGHVEVEGRTVAPGTLGDRSHRLRRGGGRDEGAEQDGAAPKGQGVMSDHEEARLCCVCQLSAGAKSPPSARCNCTRCTRCSVCTRISDMLTA